MFDNRNALNRSSSHRDALACVQAGIEAAHPTRVIPTQVEYTDGTLSVGANRFDLDAVEDVVVVGGGNAAGAAARALEGVLGNRLDRGVVVTDAPAETDHIEVRAGDHPVPSERNVDATRRLLEEVSGTGTDDLLIVLVTGGGSALMAAPAGDVSLQALQSVTDGLLHSGASIEEINTVRKHLSVHKGGGLAREATPAQVLGLVFSDVTGNDLGTIASGPTAPDGTTYEDALAVLDRYGIEAPPAIRARLERGADGAIADTPARDSRVFESVSNHVVADNLTAVEAAAEEAATRGYTPLVLSTRIRGESREAAKTHAAIGEECVASGNPVEPPVALISGGETTVDASAGGTGGPNQEFALAVGLELTDPNTVFAAVDTDGIDGASDCAGAIVDADTVTDESSARRALADHDVTPFLRANEATIVTGPTGTNVNDLRVHLVGAAERSEASNDT